MPSNERGTETSTSSTIRTPAARHLAPPRGASRPRNQSRSAAGDRRPRPPRRLRSARARRPAPWPGRGRRPVPPSLRRRGPLLGRLARPRHRTPIPSMRRRARRPRPWRRPRRPRPGQQRRRASVAAHHSGGGRVSSGGQRPGQRPQRCLGSAAAAASAAGTSPAGTGVRVGRHRRLDVVRRVAGAAVGGDREAAASVARARPSAAASTASIETNSRATACAAVGPTCQDRQADQHPPQRAVLGRLQVTSSLRPLAETSPPWCGRARSAAGPPR